MFELPEIADAPPLRCMHQAKVPSGRFCGRPATFLTIPDSGITHEFRCAKHADRNATPIPSPVVFRLVRVTVQVDFAALTWGASAAELEAADHVRAVLEAAGGRPGPAKARSWMAKAAPKSGPGSANASGGAR